MSSTSITVVATPFASRTLLSAFAAVANALLVTMTMSAEIVDACAAYDDGRLAPISGASSVRPVAKTSIVRGPDPAGVEKVAENAEPSLPTVTSTAAGASGSVTSIARMALAGKPPTVTLDDAGKDASKRPSSARSRCG